MKSLFGEEISVDEPKAYKGTTPFSHTIFKVATWYSPDLRWKIWDKELLTREAAERLAVKIGEVRGHTHYVILEIKLPGISQGIQTEAFA